MFAYGVGLLPLIRALKASFPAVDQTWYADDAGAGGVQRFKLCKAPRNRTTLRLLPRAHEEYSTVSHANLPAATAAFKDCEFTVTTATAILVVSEKDTRDRWIPGKSRILVGRGQGAFASMAGLTHRLLYRSAVAAV
jgi:hypothetical protein